MARKVAIYTVCTNGYDALKPPAKRVPGADYFLVTDDPAQSLPGYKTIAINSGDNPIKAQRKAKIWPYDLMPGYDTYVYYDASYRITGNLGSILKYFQGGFGVKRHPSRECVWQEGARIVELGKADPSEVDRQLAWYQTCQLPRNYGLQETGILIRDASDDTMKLCRVWWEEVNKFTYRDQLGLPMAIFRTGVQPQYIRPHLLNSLFRQHQHRVVHKVASTGKPRIHYSTPYATDKNIGRAYNEFCALVPSANDWICLRDGDTMWLQSDWGNQIEAIIKEHGDKFQLIGCMTNRLRGKHQLVNGEFSEDMDSRRHGKIAAKLWSEYGTHVAETKIGVAGLFLLFQRKVWDRIKFQENNIYFDTAFSKEIMRSGGKIGVAKGLYLFHQYRAWSEDPLNEIKHLTS